MTVKCCRECSNLSDLSPFCDKLLIPIKGDINPDTFYCAAFEPRRNSAKKVGGGGRKRRHHPSPPTEV